MSDLIRLDLLCPITGHILIARPTPTKSELWGCLAPLRGTPWGDLISVVPGEALSHAFHGYTKPLLECIGPAPAALLRKIPEPYRKCAMLGNCINASIKDCQPVPALPDCYDPPEAGGVMEKMLVTAVVLSWRDGYYVIVAEGEEFCL